MLSPTGSLLVRGPDRWANSGGQFGASRLHKGEEDTHKGSDLIIVAGRDIIAPGDGLYTRTGICYPRDFRYLKCVLELDEGMKVNILYCWPRLTKLKRFRRGDVIGLAQDLSARYPRIVNHVHFEVVVHGRRVDPMQFLEAA